jgi:hypothetical protein
MQVKTPTDEPAKVNEEEVKKAQKKKMEKVIMSSKLLSGGFDNRHFYMFSKKITEEIQLFSSIANDNQLKEVLLTMGQENNKDKEAEGDKPK